jgi:CBS domain-containing protein
MSFHILKRSTDTLSSIMTLEVITVDVNQKVEAALHLMVKSDVGSVVVTDSGNLVGVITERDVTRHAIRGSELLSLPVTSIMSKPVQTASPDTQISRAFELMINLGVRRLPIVDGNKLVGIVTEKDLTRWVLRVFYEPNIPEELRSLVR